MSAEIMKFLIETAEFCNVYSNICNAHTVDFITENQWQLLSLNLREEINKLDLKEQNNIICFNEQNFFSKRDYPHLCKFISDAKQHALAAQQICKQISDVVNIQRSLLHDVTAPNILITPKKQHEVEMMSELVASLANEHNINTVIDIGSGKGYLSSYLSLNYKLDVLCIDGSKANSENAVQRNTKLTKLTENKYKKYNSENCNSSTKKYSMGIFLSQQQIINNNTNFDILIKNFMCEKLKFFDKTENVELLKRNDANFNNKILLCCLHGCGNLSPCLIKRFISTNQTMILCCVGCCYHLIDEEFYRKALPREEFAVECAGFPLSSTLLQRQYKLGRNARMLASQSLDRIAQRNNVLNKALFYRAVLQVILNDHCKNAFDDYRVGRLATKCSGFEDYVNKALQKLKLTHIKLSSSGIEDYLIRHAVEEKRLYAFQQIRILLAPCIETLILLDRLAFLLENANIENAYLVQLFDPVISPRCYGLIAVKTNNK